MEATGREGKGGKGEREREREREKAEKRNYNAEERESPDTPVSIAFDAEHKSHRRMDGDETRGGGMGRVCQQNGTCWSDVVVEGPYTRPQQDEKTYWTWDDHHAYTPPTPATSPLTSSIKIAHEGT